jgi:hypothetical protein
MLARQPTVELPPLNWLHRRSLRRAWVLARMKALLWLAACDGNLEREHESRLLVLEKFMAADEARCMAQSAWEYEEKRADYWRTFLLRR